MDKFKGYRTLIVAGAYVVLGVAAAMGWGLSPDQVVEADTVVGNVVLLLQGVTSVALNPVVMAAVFAALRFKTKTPVGGEPADGLPTT